jgi:hypothetical protein
MTDSLGGKVTQAEEKEKKFKNIIKNVKKELSQTKEQVLYIYFKNSLIIHKPCGKSCRP